MGLGCHSNSPAHSIPPSLGSFPPAFPFSLVASVFLVTPLTLFFLFSCQSAAVLDLCGTLPNFPNQEVANRSLKQPEPKLPGLYATSARAHARPWFLSWIFSWSHKIMLSKARGKLEIGRGTILGRPVESLRSDY